MAIPIKTKEAMPAAIPVLTKGVRTSFKSIFTTQVKYNRLFEALKSDFSSQLKSDKSDQLKSSQVRQSKSNKTNFTSIIQTSSISILASVLFKTLSL